MPMWWCASLGSRVFYPPLYHSRSSQCFIGASPRDPRNPTQRPDHSEIGAGSALASASASFFFR